MSTCTDAHSYATTHTGQVVQAAEQVIGSLLDTKKPIASKANKLDHLSDSHAVRLTLAR
jgi:hypothetical protein